MKTAAGSIHTAEACVQSSDLAADLAYFTESLGFRLETILPADNPSVVTISGHGLRLRIEQGDSGGALRLVCGDPDGVADGAREITSPGGIRISLAAATSPLVVPPTRHRFLVQRLIDSAPWVLGRAGMEYRDLVPGRLGGSLIASHIRVPHAGPVPDVVHFHTVRFQLIFCYRGWVRLVYEDQGPPFVLRAGDCVIQPPEIRHRVLEASEEFEVIEVSLPAEHVTTVDHEMELPTPTVRRDRVFSGQRFCRSAAADGVWNPWRLKGFEARETGIAEATEGLASVKVARPVGSANGTLTNHTADILFSFVLSGTVTLFGEGQGEHPLSEGDAFVIPPGLTTSLRAPSPSLELLEVALPAGFKTVKHPDSAAG